jgi:hypothetical protein
MDEVRIYHTPLGGKAWWATLVMLVLFGVFVWVLTDDSIVSNLGVIWFCLIATGVMGLFFPLVALWERLAQRPAVTVLKDRIICHALWKTHIYRFADVEGFRYYKMDLGRTSQEFVTIHFYKQVSERKLQDASKFARAIRQFNTRLSGSQESIGASALTMKPQALCDLLNQRLKEYKKG